jgi:hypothetical protein
MGAAHCIATALVIGIGDPTPNVGAGCLSDGPVYVPIVDSTLGDPAVGVVIGFGYAITGATPLAFTMTPTPNQIATGNASAILHRAVAPAVIASDNAFWAVSPVGSLLAPVIAR